MPSWIIWAFVGCMGLRSAQRDVVARPDDPTSWTELGDAYRQRLRRRAAQEAPLAPLEAPAARLAQVAHAPPA